MLLVSGLRRRHRKRGGLRGLGGSFGGLRGSGVVLRSVALCGVVGSAGGLGG